MPFIPAEAHGTPVVIALMVYAGNAEAGERAIRPIRALATPLADMVRPLRYPEIFEGPEAPRAAFAAGTNILVDRLPSGAAESILQSLRPPPPRWSPPSYTSSAAQWRASRTKRPRSETVERR